MLSVLTTILVMVSGAASAHAGTHCLAPAFEWLPPGPVSGLERQFKVCREAGDHELIATRTFVKGGHRYALLVDPDSLETSVVADSCLACRPADPVTMGNTRFLRALAESSAPRRSIENVGIQHATYDAHGYFVTVDLCPSRRPGFDEQIFDAMELLSGARRATPIGVSISGEWILRHRAKFEWLVEQAQSQKLRIAWINHTLTHPYNTHLPMGQNFLLEKGVNIDHEILGLERLLLERGVIPSVFFRFPGLVANAAASATVRAYMLIPLGSDAWLAKHENPVPGSIILIHGNENEEAGVSDFLNWLESKRGERVEFLGVEELFGR